MKAKHSTAGSTAYALELADCLAARRDDGIGLGPTDISICERALRNFASRHARRARTIALACVFAAVAAAGARDGNANGQADIIDLAGVARKFSGYVAAVFESADDGFSREDSRR